MGVTNFGVAGRAIVTFCAVLLAFSVSGAAARPPRDGYTGTNTRRPTAQSVYGIGGWATEKQPTDEALAVGRKMARCVVKLKPAVVKAALDAPSTSEFMTVINAGSKTLSYCLDDGEITFKAPAIAGLFAEAWLEQTNAPALAPAVYDPNAPRLDFLANGPASLAQLRVGECLATRQPAEVSQLLKARPASTEEGAAFAPIMASLPGCLDKNITLKATRTSLRLAIAYALYRRSAVQPTNP